MAIKSLKQVSGFEDKLVDQFQSNVDTFTRQVGSKEIVDGQILKNIKLIAGSTNEIPHKLGRELLGWFIIRLRSNSIIWDSQDTHLRKNVSLVLNCSADTTIDLWVF